MLNESHLIIEPTTSFSQSDTSIAVASALAYSVSFLLSHFVSPESIFVIHGETVDYNGNRKR